MVLVDRYGRPVTHLRISVTLRCNHECIFCHREGIFTNPIVELEPWEWGFVAKVGVKLGIVNYKLTGGEPLVRGDIHEIVEEIHNAGGKVSMVTNGSLLKYYADKLANAGLEQVNISLHSLNPYTFYEITRGRLEKVIEGIKSAKQAGIRVKIDYLVLSLNSKEYKDIIGFAEKHGLDLNIIELIPLGLVGEEYWKLHYPLKEIEEYLEKHSIKKYYREFQFRPTYVMPTGIKVSIVKGYGNPLLCARCTRLRATPDGKLKTCIYVNKTVDMRPAIINRDEKQLEEKFREAVRLREPYFKFKDLNMYKRIWSTKTLEEVSLVDD